MSAYRKHHYVPRFYLRNFAATGGRNIHLFNIPLGRNILNASLRNQCYSARFYRDNPIIEHALAKIEGAAATVFRDNPYNQTTAYTWVGRSSHSDDLYDDPACPYSDISDYDRRDD